MHSETSEAKEAKIPSWWGDPGSKPTKASSTKNRVQKQHVSLADTWRKDFKSYVASRDYLAVGKRGGFPTSAHRLNTKKCYADKGATLCASILDSITLLLCSHSQGLHCVCQINVSLINIYPSLSIARCQKVEQHHSFKAHRILMSNIIWTALSTS